MPSPNRVFAGPRRAELRVQESLGSGNYGTVYRLGRPHNGQVLKLYNDLETARQIETKIEFMLRHRPDNASVRESGRMWHQLAWPTEKAFDERGKFVGYLMPEIDSSEAADLNLIFSEAERKSSGISGHYGFRLMVARNLAAVFQGLHSVGICILDVKPDNIRFYKKSAYICLLDCDSFIPIDRLKTAMGAACTPGYILPEATVTANGDDVDYDVLDFRDKQDDFALAILIFRLANEGFHPFSGIPKIRKLSGLDAQERIFAGGYSFGLIPNPAIAPPPYSLHKWFDDGTRRLFDRAFASRRRPTAAEWLDHLQSYVSRGSGKLIKCTVTPKHLHFSKGCGLCEREQALARKARARAKAAPTAKAPTATQSPRPPISPPAAPVRAAAATAPISQAPTNPVPLGKIIAWGVGGLIALSIFSQIASCSRRLGSVPPRSSSTPAPAYTVQYFSSSQSYAVAPSPGILRINVRSGPGPGYSQVAQLSVGDRLTGNGFTAGTDGMTWIAVTLPGGRSGFVAERLLSAAGVEAQPTEQPSFACTGDLGLVERTICDDASLAAKDREVAALYTRLSPSSVGSEVADTQRTWLQERNRCGASGNVSACINSMYDVRIEALRNWYSVQAQRTEITPRETPSVSSVPNPVEVRRPSYSSPSEGAYRPNPPAPIVTCILPSGQEVQLSYENCRQQSGVIYR